MNTFLTEETLKENVVYTVRSYRYLYGNCEYYYIIKLGKTGGVNMQMIVTGGKLFGHLEWNRLRGDKKEIKFKKTSTSLSSDVSADHIVILGHNDSVTLEA